MFDVYISEEHISWHLHEHVLSWTMNGKVLLRAHVQRIKWSVVSICRRCPYICLSAQSPDPGLSISAKYLQVVQNVEKRSCLCFFLLDTLYTCLKFILSWHRGHAYWSHPETWLPREMMVSVSLEFTTQRAFVRQRFTPILMEAHTCIALVHFASHFIPYSRKIWRELYLAKWPPSSQK